MKVKFSSPYVLGTRETIILSMKHPPCSYFGCEEKVCEHDVDYPPPSMRFCQKHSEELGAYIQNHNIPKILGFWVKANGGAKRLAETF